MLRGSEKQIAWAEDIIEKFEQTVKAFKESLNNEDSLISSNETEQATAIVDEFVEMLKNQHAGFIIDHKNALTDQESYKIYDGTIGTQNIQKHVVATINHIRCEAERYDENGQMKW